MVATRNALRWTALAGLCLLAGVICWVLMVEGMMALFAPFGSWKLPGIAKVTVTQIEQDETGKLTGNVLVIEGERSRTLRMAKEECAELEADTEVWILDNYFANGPRPDQFRLSLLRLILEYPEPLLALILWAIWRLRRSQVQAAKAVEENPVRERKVWRDEFHTRAERFTAPKQSENKE